MVEAAVVFPLVILTVITCVMICMLFYSRAIEQSRLHIAVRHSAESAGEHTEYPDKGPGWDGSLDTSKKGFIYTSHGKGLIFMKKKGLLSARTDKKIEGVWTAVDGVSYVRYCTLANHVAEELEDYK